MSIPDRIRLVEDEIQQISNSTDVSLMAVTKYYSLDQIEEVLESHCRLFGESKVQDALKKIDYFSQYTDISWHLIGHLQRNKAKKAVQAFDCIQSVDSLRLCEKINEEAALINKKMPILLQLNIAREEGKYGFLPEDIFEMENITLEDYLSQGSHIFTQQIKNMFLMDAIDIQGIMMIPPNHLERDQSHRLYELTKRCFDLLNKQFKGRMTVLSMGMSGDYPIAVKEGSTLVRLGQTLLA